MKSLIFILLVVQASIADVCKYIDAINATEPKLILKSLTSSPAEVEKSAEFKQYYSNYYFFIQRGLEAKAVNLYDDYLNEASSCRSSILGRLEGIDAKSVAEAMVLKLKASETLQNHFKSVFGVKGYEKFVKDLQSVETTSHILHAVVMLPVSGVAAMVALGALLSGANVVAGGAAIVMMAGIGYAGYRIYRENKLSLKAAIVLSAKEKQSIADQASITASELTRIVVKNAKLEQLKTVNP